MEIPEQLSCLFTAQVDRRGGTYVIEIPDREVDLGGLSESGTYRVALSPAHTPTTREPQSQPRKQSPEEATEAEPSAKASYHDQPVREGETRIVEIEGLGDQGDGIARVENGLILIVPDTEPTERVKVTVTDVHDSLAFAAVTERLDYYE